MVFVFATAKPWQNKDIITLVCLEQILLQQHCCIALNDDWGHIWFPVTAVQAMCVCVLVLQYKPLFYYFDENTFDVLYYNTTPCTKLFGVLYYNKSPCCAVIQIHLASFDSDKC